MDVCFMVDISNINVCTDAIAIALFDTNIVESQL